MLIGCLASRYTRTSFLSAMMLRLGRSRSPSCGYRTQACASCMGHIWYQLFKAQSISRREISYLSPITTGKYKSPYLSSRTLGSGFMQPGPFIESHHQGKKSSDTMATITEKISLPSSIGDISEKPKHNAHSKEVFLSPGFDPKHIKIVAQEAVLLGGGAAAIMLQVAEAGVGAGVNEHSNFAYRAVDRLRTTMTYVYCMAYGTAEERRTIVDMVTRVHESVYGTLNEGRDAGKQYSALDPHLQLWVAATLYWTAMEIYEAIFGKIGDPKLHEAIYKDYSILACSLQVPPEMWPPTRRDFYAYWNQKINTLEVTEHARQITRDLLYDVKIPFYFKMGMPSLRVFTAEFLPPRIREAYGLEEHRKMFKLHKLAIKAMYRPLPGWLRSIPVKFYMWDMRKRLRRNQKIFDKA